MISSPFSSKIERGAYSAIVYKDGDLYIAEDEKGNTIIENTDAATVIQKAIDDYAQDGLVFIKPTLTLTSALKILKSRSKIKFTGIVNTATGINGIEIGDATHEVLGAVVELALLDGGDESANGIVLSNTSISRIQFDQIKKYNIGLYFAPCTNGKANENRIIGVQMGHFGAAGIRFSSSALTMEGNHFETNIFDAPIGLDIISGGNSRFQTYLGVIDCVSSGGSEDIKDAVGHQLFICDFVRRNTCTIHKDSLLINVNANACGGNLVEAQGGKADFMNIGFTPFIIYDFNRDSTGDWAKTACTMGTPSNSVTRLTATGGDPYITRDVEIDGGQAQLILIRYKFVSGTATSPQTGALYWSTSGHGISGSYYHAYTIDADVGKWNLAIMDMSTPDAGGTDWIDNIITSIRWDFVNSQSIYDIDYFAIGTRGYASMYNLDDALKTPASASAQGNKGDIRWDASYIYICTATDTWKRVAIATW